MPEIFFDCPRSGSKAPHAKISTMTTTDSIKLIHTLAEKYLENLSLSLNNCAALTKKTSKNEQVSMYKVIYKGAANPYADKVFISNRATIKTETISSSTTVILETIMG